jgi:hypothetical protein
MEHGHLHLAREWFQQGLNIEDPGHVARPEPRSSMPAIMASTALAKIALLQGLNLDLCMFPVVDFVYVIMILILSLESSLL